MVKEISEPEELVTARKLKAMLYSQCAGNIAMLDKIESDLLLALDDYISRFSKRPISIT